MVCRTWTGHKIKLVIDRETGRFVLFNNRFRMDFQDDTGYLYDCNSKTPLFKGRLHGNYWFFEGQDNIREDKDPYVAAIQVLYDLIQYREHG